MKKRIKIALKDKLTRDILAFFYKNQASVDSVGGLSTWVRNDRKEVQAAMENLVKLGVLEKDSMGVTKGYSYTRDPKIMKIVKELMRDE